MFCLAKTIFISLFCAHWPTNGTEVQIFISEVKIANKLDLMGFIVHLIYAVSLQAEASLGIIDQVSSSYLQKPWIIIMQIMIFDNNPLASPRLVTQNIM